MRSPERNVPALLDLDGVCSDPLDTSRALRQLPQAAAAARGRARGEAAMSEMEGIEGRFWPVARSRSCCCIWRLAFRRMAA